MSLYPIRTILSLLILLNCAWAEPASAPNSNTLPIYVTSNTATADLKAGTLIYQGNFVATQGARKLTGNTLTVTRDQNNQIQSFVARGNPAVSQEKPNPTSALTVGQADTIYYFPGKNLVKYVNNAKFTQNGNVFTGNLITYNTVTQVVSAPQTNSNARTSTIILPPSDQQQKATGS